MTTRQNRFITKYHVNKAGLRWLPYPIFAVKFYVRSSIRHCRLVVSIRTEHVDRSSVLESEEILSRAYRSVSGEGYYHLTPIGF